MEGRHALKSINLRSRLPAMCGVSFVVGAAIELMMCTSGFYNVYNVKQGQKAAEKSRDDDEFWLRVNARRQAKSNAGTICTEDPIPSPSSS
jgi:hypothetical protein